MPVQLMPDETAMLPDSAAGKFNRQWPVTRADQIFAELNFVRREDADAAPPA